MRVYDVISCDFDSFDFLKVLNQIVEVMSCVISFELIIKDHSKYNKGFFTIIYLFLMKPFS